MARNTALTGRTGLRILALAAALSLATAGESSIAEEPAWAGVASATAPMTAPRDRHQPSPAGAVGGPGPSTAGGDHGRHGTAHGRSGAGDSTTGRPSAPASLAPGQGYAEHGQPDGGDHDGSQVGEGHGDQGGHGGEAAPVTRPRALVLATFALVNMASLAVAVVVRRRHSHRRAHRRTPPALTTTT